MMSSMNHAHTPALLGEERQFGKLVQPINHFLLLQIKHAKTLSHLTLPEKNGTFTGSCYREKVWNKAFQATTFQRQPEAGSEN